MKLVKKKNGRFIESEYLVNGYGEQPYLTSNDRCLEGLIDPYKVDMSTRRDAKVGDLCVKTILDTVNKENGPKTIEDAMEALKNYKSNSNKGLVDMFSSFYEKYITIANEKIKLLRNIPNKKEYINHKESLRFITRTTNELLKNCPDLVISIAVKQIVREYLFNKLSSLSFDQISALGDKINLKNGVDLMLVDINAFFPEESKANGIYNLSKRLLVSLVDNIYIKGKMLCDSCINRRGNSPCSAVRISNPLNLPFVTEGYLIVNNRDVIVDSKVIGCGNCLSIKDVRNDKNKVKSDSDGSSVEKTTPNSFESFRRVKF